MTSAATRAAAVHAERAADDTRPAHEDCFPCGRGRQTAARAGTRGSPTTGFPGFFNGAPRRSSAGCTCVCRLRTRSTPVVTWRNSRGLGSVRGALSRPRRRCPATSLCRSSRQAASMPVLDGSPGGCLARLSAEGSVALGNLGPAAGVFH